MNDFIEKEVTLRIRVPADFDHEDERMLDDEFSHILEKQGWQLLKSEEYKTVNDSLEFVFDEELCVQDDHCECVDGYLWATESMVNRLKETVHELHSPDVLDTMDNMNFYPVYNVRENGIHITCSYDYFDGEDKHGVCQLLLSDNESKALIEAMEAYCLKENDVGCHHFVNDARIHAGLPVIDIPHQPHSPHKPLDQQILSAAAKVFENTSAHDQKEPEAVR